MPEFIDFREYLIGRVVRPGFCGRIGIRLACTATVGVVGKTGHRGRQSSSAVGIGGAAAGDETARGVGKRPDIAARIGDARRVPVCIVRVAGDIPEFIRLRRHAMQGRCPRIGNTRTIRLVDVQDVAAAVVADLGDGRDLRACAIGIRWRDLDRQTIEVAIDDGYVQERVFGLNHLSKTVGLELPIVAALIAQNADRIRGFCEGLATPRLEPCGRDGGQGLGRTIGIRDGIQAARGCVVSEAGRIAVRVDGRS